MKKILSLFLALVAVLSLVSCKKDEPRTYVVDGEFTAYVAHDNDGALQLTWVTVTIENDEIKSFYIDQLQSKDGQWNEKTKKELGYKYGMHQYTAQIFADLKDDANAAVLEEYKAWLKANEKLEWHEQATLIEERFLTTLDVNTNNEGYIQGITNVTIKDNQYIALAKKAVENAKAGIVNVFDANVYDGKLNLTSASAKVNAEGKLSEVKIDELQTTEGKWNAQTKQQLGYKYGMHQYTAQIFANLKDDANAAVVEEYKTWLKDNGQLEWFEQVDALAAAWLGGANVSNIASVTGVTIKDSGYSKVLNALLSEGWSR